jgi:hypothetical protein
MITKTQGCQARIFDLAHFNLRAYFEALHRSVPNIARGTLLENAKANVKTGKPKMNE